MTQPRVGPQAQSMQSLLRQWWFSVSLVLEGWWAGPGGQGTGPHGEEDKDEVVALLPAHWTMLVRIQLFT